MEFITLAAITAGFLFVLHLGDRILDELREIKTLLEKKKSDE